MSDGKNIEQNLHAMEMCLRAIITLDYFDERRSKTITLTQQRAHEIWENHSVFMGPDQRSISRQGFENALREAGFEIVKGPPQ